MIRIVNEVLRASVVPAGKVVIDLVASPDVRVAVGTIFVEARSSVRRHFGTGGTAAAAAS